MRVTGSVVCVATIVVLMAGGCEIEYRCDRIRECGYAESCDENHPPDLEADDDSFDQRPDDDCLDACIDSSSCSELPSCFSQCRR